MSDYNWGSFTARINISPPIASIYKMWATAEGMEAWFLRRCEIQGEDSIQKGASDYIKKGDRFAWRWHGWPDDMQEKGEILEANGTDSLKFTFGQEGAEDMICTVKIYSEEDENICEITQENIPDNEEGKTFYHIGCLTGWSFYLTNMKSILEGGVDLRNKNERLTKMINS